MDEKELQKILADFKAQFEELEEIKAENAARYANLTEEEYVKQLTEDYEEVYEHAMNNGVTVAVIPNEDEESGK